MVKGKPKIYFHLLYRFQFKNTAALKKNILKLFETERKNVDEINYIFCSDEYLLNINKEYLKHDYYTDIVTFPLHEEQEPIKADIFISIERVSENAKNLKINFTEELARIIIHGALHLCGYKDKTKIEIHKMRSAEDKYLELFSFT